MPDLKARGVVRWGILGCGDVTEVKSGPAFAQAAGSELGAVMRRDGTRAADYARRHGVPRWYDNVAALVADPEIDAVYIATPPEAHLDCALQVAAAGKPAYVEKPMARNAVECQMMIDAFAAAGQPLFVAYYRRRLPRFLLVGEWMETGAIGRVTSLHYEQTAPYHRKDAGWRINAQSAGGGHFLDLGSHTLDLIDYHFGALQDVAGVAANRASGYAVEDSVAMSFRTAQGIPGTARWNFAADADVDRLRIEGTEGHLECSIFAPGPVRLVNSRGSQEIMREHPPHVQQPLIQSVVDELLGRGTCPSTGTSALRTSVVMDRVLGGYYGPAGARALIPDRTRPRITPGPP
jgi:predicted dehydrogenase